VDKNLRALELFLFSNSEHRDYKTPKIVLGKYDGFLNGMQKNKKEKSSFIQKIPLKNIYI